MTFYIAQYEINKDEVISLTKIDVSLDDMQNLMKISRSDPMYADFPINEMQSDYFEKECSYRFDFRYYEYHLCNHV